MIHRVYKFSRNLILLAIAFVIALAVLFTNKDLVPYLAQKYLKDFDISYNSVEGTLLNGATLHALKYKDSIAIKTLHIDYNILMLLGPTPRLSKIEADTAIFDSDKFFVSDSNSSDAFMLPFYLSKLELKNTKIIVDNETFLVDLNSSGIHFDEVLSAKKVALSINSSFANTKIDGKIEANRLKAEGSLALDDSIRNEQLNFLKGIPKSLDIALDATLERVVASTHLKSLTLSADENVEIKNSDLNVTYFIENDYFSAEAKYLLSSMGYEAQFKESALFSSNTAYYTKADAEIIKTPSKLPFKNFTLEASGDAQSLVAKIDADTIKVDALSLDYENFSLHTKNSTLSLSFLEELPELLKKDTLLLNADAVLKLSPLSLAGTIESDDLYATAKTTFELDTKSALYQSKIVPKPKSELFREYDLKRFLPLKVTLYDDYNAQMINLDANVLNITLFKNRQNLKGWGNLSSSNFDLSANLEKEKSIKILAKLPSLKTLLADLEMSSKDKNRVYDGELDVDVTVTLSEKIALGANLHMPWYIIKLDSQTSYTGKNLSVELKSVGDEIKIENYTLEFMNQKIYSKKESTLLLDAKSNILVKEFWIYDNLLVTGAIEPKKMKGSLRLKSNSFSYKGKEGSVSAKTDLKVEFEGDSKQQIEGSITLLDGVISYVMPSDYSILDSDIIILQDMKQKESKNRYVNIHIDSAKPIVYKTKNIDVHFTPDLTIFQEPESEVKILGMVTINEGEVISGEKVFEFDKSEIYFYGANPINPYLNLNMHYYTLDYIDIEIYVTNTLGAPVLIFSSKPALSQNDIMSYILFGESASSIFDGSSGTNKVAVSSLLLGTGLKDIFSKTTGVKIDTLNILTNKEGTLGYEIGSRFNKQIRVVYKNDTVSSVIVQYSLTKSIRVDVDVRETGQGVSIIYIKDF